MYADVFDEDLIETNIKVNDITNTTIDRTP